MNFIIRLSSQKFPPRDLLLNLIDTVFEVFLLGLILIDIDFLKKLLNFIRFSILCQLYGQLGRFVLDVSSEEVRYQWVR